MGDTIPPAATAHLLAHLPRYEFREHPAASRMSEVYKAYDRDSGQWVAVKFLLPHLTTDKTEVIRFYREAQFGRRLAHSNIVQCLRSWQSGEPVHLVMPYVAGQSLAVVLGEEKQLNARRLAHLVSQVASALDYMHSKRIVHRDIKPENVLISGEPPTEHALVCDFGISVDQADPRLTRPGRSPGTPGYTAPEYGNLDEPAYATPSGDQFSLAQLIYRCLTGEEAPTTDPESGERHVVAPPIRNWRPDLPTAVDNVVRKAMSPQPTDRFPSCGAFASAFEKAIRHGRRRAAVRGAVGLATRPIRRAFQRHPHITNSTIALGTALIISAAFLVPALLTYTPSIATNTISQAKIAGPRARADNDYSGDGVGDLLAITTDGGLRYCPNQTKTQPNHVPFDTCTDISQDGWDTYRHILEADMTGNGVTDLLAVTMDGQLYYYRNLRPTNPQAPLLDERIYTGNGWFSNFRIMLADVSGDGSADLLGIDPSASSGKLIYCANNASVNPDHRPFVGCEDGGGANWNSATQVSAGDLDRDGRADLLTTDTRGTMFYFHNSGHSPPFSTGVPIGGGWEKDSKIFLADVNGDGLLDVIGTMPSTSGFRTCINQIAQSANRIPLTSCVNVPLGLKPTSQLRTVDITDNQLAGLIDIDGDGLRYCPNNSKGTTLTTCTPGFGSGWTGIETILTNTTER
ncbi:protein kinase domain-containing protein [Fodinicola acaciae]|uniref:protein kinase domain-containing protein n=1 Tax=Fodinicola acaciae TaxID=2681555 RepID=UPI0013D3EC10|nr:protein kinase [Fodinicola acaciae]